MLKRLLQFIRSAGAPSEDDTDRDGLLSYSAEYHAMAVGLFAGLVTGATGRWEIAVAVALVAVGIRKAKTGHMRDVRTEIAYAGGGFAAGLLVGLAVAG